MEIDPICTVRVAVQWYQSIVKLGIVFNTAEHRPQIARQDPHRARLLGLSRLSLSVFRSWQANMMILR